MAPRNRHLVSFNLNFALLILSILSYWEASVLDDESGRLSGLGISCYTAFFRSSFLTECRNDRTIALYAGIRNIPSPRFYGPDVLLNALTS
jgi:hypothetical protein